MNTETEAQESPLEGEPDLPEQEAAAEVIADPLPQLIVCYEKTNNELTASTFSSDSPSQVNSFQLQQSLQAKGYGDWQHHDEAIKELCQALCQGTEYKGVIGCKQDASLIVEVSSDKLSASAKTLAAKGGEPLNSEIINDAIEQAGIAPRCRKQDAIDSLVEQAGSERTCIAEAIEASASTPSRFERLLAEEKTAPSIDDKGTVDHKDIQNFIVISEGEPLLERIPAIIGEPGLNVLGEEIPAQQLEDLPFPSKLEGVIPDPDNPNRLIAETSGHPVFTDKGVSVDPVLQLPCVNMQSGNINFSGSVAVRGDVESGFSVKADGDVFIKGSLVKAKVTAGGNITVGEGIIGAEHNGDEDDEEKNYAAIVTAANNIEARFITLAKIQCGGDITVKEYLLNSDVMSKANIYLGQSGGKGYIMGGNTHADIGVTAKVLGSDAYVATPVSAGRCEQAKAQLAKIEAEFQRYKSEHEAHEQQLQELRSEGADDKAIEPLEQAVQKEQKNMSSLAQKSKKICAVIDVMSDARITATNTLYPNVKLAINGSEIVSKNKRGHTILAKVGKGITLVKE